MAIQYGSMNPYAGLADSVAMGMQLGRMNRRSEIEVSDPDEYIKKTVKPIPTFDTTGYTKDTESQTEKYSKIKKDIESTYSDKNKKDEAYTKQISDPLVLGAAKNGINPKMIEGLNKEIKQGNFKEADNIAGLLLDKIGKGTPEGQAFANKIVQMKTAYSDYISKTKVAKEEQSEIVKFAYKGALDTIKEIKDEPYKWLDPKSGRPSESVVNLLKNEAKYMSGLGPAGYVEYMDERNKKTPTRSGASRGTRKQYIDTINKSFENNKWTNAESKAYEEFSKFLLSKPAGDFNQNDANAWTAIQKKWKINSSLPAETTKSTEGYGF